MNETKNSIISNLNNDIDFNNILKCYCSGNKRNMLNDLKQEILLILLNKEEEFIIDLYKKKELKYYYTRLISNQINSTSSNFYYKYRKIEIDKENYYDLGIDLIQDDYTINYMFREEEVGYEIVNEIDFDIFEYIKNKKIYNWLEIELFISYYKIYPTFIEPTFENKVTYDLISDKLKLSKYKIWSIMTTMKIKLYESLIEDKLTTNNDLVMFIDKYKKNIIKTNI